MSLVRVLEIPTPSGNWHFSGGEAQRFIEVDWFRDDEIEGIMLPEDECPSMRTEAGIKRTVEYIKQKNYFDPGKAYLILSPDACVTIGYDPDAMIRERSE